MQKIRTFQRSAATNAGPDPAPAVDPVGMRLNKFLAHAGLGTRRRAADYVKAGRVSVNGRTEKNPAYPVAAGDVVTYGGRPLSPARPPVYLLLNKPAGVSAAETPQHFGQPALASLAPRPVGNLAAPTRGLLLLTNDTDLADRLATTAKSVYTLTTAAPLGPHHRAELEAGTTLADGTPLRPDWLRTSGPDQQPRLSLQLRGTDDAPLRATLEHLGHPAELLDRTHLAGLTKKHLPRGFWRYLTEEEIRRLRHFS